MKRAAAAIAAVGLVGVAFVVWRARAPAPAASPPEAQAETAPLPVAPAPPVTSPPVASPPPRPAAAGRDERPALSEPALMATLREMGGDGARALDRARA